MKIDWQTVSDSRLVGRSFIKKIKILIFYIFYQPKIFFNDKNDFKTAYVGPLNKRNDQLIYDSYYKKFLSKNSDGFTLVDIGHSFDALFFPCVLLVLKCFYKKEYSINILLKEVFKYKEYSTDETKIFKNVDVIYFMNESVYEFQLLISTVRRLNPNIKIVTFQHAAYPEYNPDIFDESQVCYKLSISDNYILWDEFTCLQYNKLGKYTKILRRPSIKRFSPYTKPLIKKNKFLFFLGGPQCREQNNKLLEKIKIKGIFSRCFFVLHPNEYKSLYDYPLNIVRDVDDLNEYDIVFSFASTVILELLNASVPLVAIKSERYNEYGNFVNVNDIDAAINFIIVDETVKCSVEFSYL